jgi:glutaredoxin
MSRVTLFTKPGCHLCDDVKAVIERVQARKPFVLELRNILDNPQDYERYQYDIPVVLVNGTEIARHRLSEVRLDWALGNIPEQ